MPVLCAFCAHRFTKINAIHSHLHRQYCFSAFPFQYLLLLLLLSVGTYFPFDFRIRRDFHVCVWRRWTCFYPANKMCLTTEQNVKLFQCAEFLRFTFFFIWVCGFSWKPEILSNSYFVRTPFKSSMMAEPKLAMYWLQSNSLLNSGKKVWWHVFSSCCDVAALLDLKIYKMNEHSFNFFPCAFQLTDNTTFLWPQK